MQHKTYHMAFLNTVTLGDTTAVVHRSMNYEVPADTGLTKHAMNTARQAIIDALYAEGISKEADITPHAMSVTLLTD